MTKPPATEMAELFKVWSDAFGEDNADLMADMLNPGAASQTKTTYGASPIKRGRRTKVDMQRIRDAILTIVERYRPMTVRQIFYRLVCEGVIDKTEKEYKSTICRLLADMRRDGSMPYDWIADNTRWMRKPRTHESMQALLEDSQRTYRRALWNDQPAYVEVWLEKEALAGVLLEVTDKWDVPLMVTRGYPSLSFLFSAGQAIKEQVEPVYLYYFGDHDPSGVDISRHVEEEIRKFAPDADIHFERVAVNEDQIDSLDLPTRPTKKSDSRSKNFEGESVEVDAIEPDMLRDMAEEVIVQHLDRDVLRRTRVAEDAERDTLSAMLDGLSSGGSVKAFKAMQAGDRKVPWSWKDLANRMIRTYNGYVNARPDMPQEESQKAALAVGVTIRDVGQQILDRLAHGDDERVNLG